MPSITINNKAIETPDGATILQAAQAAGINIPTLCYLQNRSAIASCRVCVVEVAGAEHPVAACSTVVREGMEITTDSPRLETYRRIALELIVAELSVDEQTTLDDLGELGALCKAYGVALVPASVKRPQKPLQTGNPFLEFNPNKCIRCQRCVGACNTAARNHILQTGKRGVRSIIEAPFGPDWRASACESCGNCAQACPTGAITIVRHRERDLSDATYVRTTCPHCGVGCQLNLVVKDGHVVDAQGADGPSNHGLLCVKGRFGSFDFVDASDRITTPLIKNRETGEFAPATWDEALDLVARRFLELRETHGGESLAAFACSRSTNEDIYLFQKMARTALYTNNVDCCARV